MAASSPDDDFVAEINVTPFVDVMLVLLVIFMITAPMMTEGLSVDLPTVETAETLATEDDHAVLTIRADGAQTAAQPAPKALPAKPQPSAPAPGGQADTHGSTGPQPYQLGGLSAYEHSALDQRPRITRRVEPEYPAKARRMNVQGTVLVQMVVDAAGQPRNCTIVRATPDGFFEKAALSAARQMRFAPGKIRGQAVNTVVQLPFSFKLQ